MDYIDLIKEIKEYIDLKFKKLLFIADSISEDEFSNYHFPYYYYVGINEEQINKSGLSSIKKKFLLKLVSDRSEKIVLFILNKMHSIFYMESAHNIDVNIFFIKSQLELLRNINNNISIKYVIEDKRYNFLIYVTKASINELKEPSFLYKRLIDFTIEEIQELNIDPIKKEIILEILLIRKSHTNKILKKLLKLKLDTTDKTFSYKFARYIDLYQLSDLNLSSKKLSLLQIMLKNTFEQELELLLLERKDLRQNIKFINRYLLLLK